MHLATMGKSMQGLKEKTVVVKIGGEAFTDGYAEGILRDVQFLSSRMNVVVGHGGGKEINEAVKRRNPGYEPVLVDGLRRTGKDELEALKEVMPPIGEGIMQSINRMGGNAVHIMGNLGLLRVEPIAGLGYVGNVIEVNTSLLHRIMSSGAVPVVTPLGFGEEPVYNINGDMALSSIAVALVQFTPVRLVFVTKVDGVMEHSNLLHVIDGKRIEHLLRRGIIDGGMKPKATAGLYAARNGVETVSLINGTKNQALRLEIEGKNRVNTLIVA